MPRPQKFRHINRNFRPPTNLFRPHKMDEYDKIYITREELEALKLRYYDKNDFNKRYTQNEAAEAMKISQTTYSRIINRTFKKVTKALVEGKALEIQPGFSSDKQEDFFNRELGEHKIIFDGFGCLECGYQFEIDTNNLNLPDSLQKEKPICENCESGLTYRLKKKGPKLNKKF